MFTYDRFQMFEGPAPHVSCRGAGNAEFFYLEKKSHLPTYKYAKWGESAKICFLTTWSSIYDDKCGDCRTPAMNICNVKRLILCKHHFKSCGYNKLLRFLKRLYLNK